MYYNSSSDNGMSIWVIFLILALFGTCWFAKSMGSDHASAEKEFVRWTKEMNMDVSGHSCNNHDSDNDGYVSCSYMLSGEPHTVECAAAFNMQHGCRNPKMALRNTNVNVNRAK